MFITAPQKHLSRPVLLFLLIFSLTACQSYTSKESWPTNIPDRQIFIDGFLEKRGLKTLDSKTIDAHLVWIVRFYQGTVIYPSGWNRVSEMFLASIEPPLAKQAMSRRMRNLGIEIANEWAQDNEVRLIENNAVATWGSALRTAAQRNDQEAYVSLVEADVKALINGKLLAREIRYERYYPEEDYDNF